MFHLVGAAHIEIRHLLSGLQSLDRPVQLFHRGGDPPGQPEVHKNQQIHGKEHHEQEEQDQLSVVVPQRRGGHHRHQLPAGVSHGLDRHLPRLPLERLRMGAVGILGGGQIVFLQEPCVNELLAGMINDLTAAVRQIQIALGVAQIHVLADLLNAAEAHIHQQHAALNISCPGQLHLAAQGDHPPVAVVRVLKEVLHMGCGKVEIFNPLLRRGKPGFPLRRHAVFQFPKRRGRDEVAVSGEDRDGHHALPAAFPQQLQGVVQRRLRQIRILDDLVIHGIGNPHHIPQIAVHIQIDLGEDPAAAFRHLRIGGVGKAQKQRQPQKNHAGHRHGGKGRREHHLNAGAVVKRLPASQQAGAQLLHGHLLSRLLIPPGTGSGSRRNDV